MSKTDIKKDLEVTSIPSPTPRSSLVVGDHNMNRCLLLLAAVTAASEMGMRVVFMTQTQIQSLPLSLQKLMASLSPESLKKIRFCYPRTVDELLQQVASLHESTNRSPTPPSLIIVDRLESYLCAPRGSSGSGIHPGALTCAAHLSALLCDTAAFLTTLLKQHSSNLAPCRLIASFQSEEDSGQTSGDASATDQILDVLDRYFQMRCTLDQDRSYGATAAGLQELWHIYLSGTALPETCGSKDCDDQPCAAQEWQMLILPDGLMEFKLV